MEIEKSDYQMQVINRIKSIRYDLNISQVKIAEWLNLSNGQVGNIESVKFPHKYTLKQLKCICDHFNIKIENILLDSDEKKSIESVINKLIEYEE